MDKPRLYAAQQVIAGNTELFWCRASLLVLLFYGSAFFKIADMHLVVYEQDVGVQNTGLEMIGLLCLLNIYISIYPILELADNKIIMICLFLIYDWKKKIQSKIYIAHGHGWFKYFHEYAVFVHTDILIFYVHNWDCSY